MEGIKKLLADMKKRKLVLDEAMRRELLASFAEIDESEMLSSVEEEMEEEEEEVEENKQNG